MDAGIVEPVAKQVRMNLTPLHLQLGEVTRIRKAID
jgi:hypothetical protein